MNISLILLLAVGVFGAPNSKIESGLRNALQEKESANILISFRQGTSQALHSASVQSFATRAQKLNGVTQLLRANALDSQASVAEFLKHSKIQFKSFWISNQIYVQGADEAIVTALANFPEVSAVVLEKFITVEALTSSRSSRNDTELTWGLQKIQVADVWNHEAGNNGEGVVVGGIDTGVRVTHEALRNNYRGEYGWYDPYQGEELPHDTHGHGTHTMGTIVGSHGIGVAPGAQWIACAACNANGNCFDAQFLACGEFMQCPHLPDGSSPDCSRAPHLVSNSLGGRGGISVFYPIVESWYAAGIVPIFANGNLGLFDPDYLCGGAGSPADHPLAIAVGNTRIDDSLSPRSSQGPAVSGLIKPELSAPGTDVISAVHTSDTAYDSFSGTSMACPHVAGVAALLLSQNENLSVDEVKSYLLHGNEQNGLLSPGVNCGGVSDSTYPNNAFGNGRISALNSFIKLIEDSN